MRADEAYILSKGYTDESLEGGGAIKGKNCTIDSIEPISGGQRVTFKWTLDDGTEQTSTMDVMDGVDGQDGQDGQDGKGIKSVAINEESHLIITYTDDTTYDAGAIEVHSAVDSVNGKTGEVTLTASDVGALPSDTEIPSKTSDLTNDSNFVADANYVHTDNNYDATAKDIVDGVTTALAGKVDKETGKSLIDLTTVVDGASYDSTNHLILFKNGTTTLFSLDAAAFVKDGMVDTVAIVGANLVITFNTDAGKQDISIPLSDIFDPDNYYDKTATDTLLGAKADQTEVNDIVNVYGAKNLMKTTVSSHTQNGITKTVNADGSFTLNGTATDNTYFYWMSRTEFPTENIQYTYSIETSAVWGIGKAIAGIDKRNETAYVDRYKSIFADGTTHIEGTFTGESGYYAQAWIFIPNGTQLTDVIVKGMIRLASISDNTYVPYAPTNKELADSKAEQAEVNDIVNVLGAKNLLPFNLSHIKKVNGGGTWNGNVYTYRDITYTVNADGTITVNGTANGDSIFRVLDNASLDFALNSNKTYYYTGSPTSGSSASTYYSYYSELVGGTWTYFMSYGTSDTSITPNASATQIVVDIFVKSGKTINNQIFKPMIRLASVPDDTYVPYAPTNAKLNEEKMSYADNGVLGAKNLLPNTATTQTVNGVTFTINADGTITANGTASSNARLIIASATAMTNACADADVILSGCPSGGSEYKYQIYTRTSAGYLHEYGDGIVITQGTSFIEELSILVSSGQTVSNIVFKPMIRLASDPDNTYVPYAMTNRELTESKAKIIYGTTLWSANTPVTITLPRLGGLLVGGRNNKGFAIYVCENGNELVVLSGGDFVTVSISDLTISLTFSSVYGSSFNWKYINSETGSY